MLILAILLFFFAMIIALKNGNPVTVLAIAFVIGLVATVWFLT